MFAYLFEWLSSKMFFLASEAVTSLPGRLSLLLSRHILSATVTFATWGQLHSHVPHFHPQQWSHMFVKMCMLCAFSGPICSRAFSPMSPALPRGPSWSLTLFIQTEQLGPSQPKQRDEGSGGWVENLSWKLQVKPTVGNVSLFPLSFFLCFF